jgi:amidohydrolase
MQLHCVGPTGIALLCAAAAVMPATAADLKSDLEPAIAAIEQKVIGWRRDIHRHPELGNREFRTAKVVADHLRSLGLEVRTGIAHTGIVATLRGTLPGPVVALRADMDALPVTEQTGLPFASTVRTTYAGQETGVMHACGHDAHVAILMGVAEVLAGMRERLPGAVRFIFQPAEEGPPEGEEGGAPLMIAEGVLDGPDAPQAIFGLHVWPQAPGSLHVRPEGIMASSDHLYLTVRGHQTHGSLPWRGVDPIAVAAQIIGALQFIVSRQVDLTLAPAVLTIGSIHGGNRFNIIPDEVRMEGTLRTFDSEMREDILARITRTAQAIADAAGAAAEVHFVNAAPVTFNDPDLTARMKPSLQWAAGDMGVHVPRLIPGAEDFAYFQQRIPGMYFFLGVNREGVAPEEAAPNHSPHFYVNEDALLTGVRALAALAVDYLAGGR